MRWDEQRKSMQQDAQAKAQLAQYNDELARKRLEVGEWKCVSMWGVLLVGGWVGGVMVVQHEA